MTPRGWIYTGVGLLAAAAFLALPVGGLGQVLVLVGAGWAVTAVVVERVYHRRTLPGFWLLLTIGFVLYAIATALEQPAEGRDLERNLEDVRRKGTRARDAVCDVLTTLRLAEVDPRGRIPVARLRTVFQQMRCGARGALTVQHLLEHGAPRSGSSADLARRAATDLEDLAHLALSQPTAPRKFDPGPTPTYEAGNVLATTSYRAEETLRRFGAY